MAGAVPAQAVDGENRSQALAELINADALGIDAATAVTAEQNFLDDEGAAPATSTINAELLDQLVAADLGGISLETGLDGLGVGALSGFASTPEPTNAIAASGAVTSDGSIAVDGSTTTGFASVDLTSALADLGLGTEGVVNDLSLELGALASRAEETEGAVESQYALAGAQLSIDSPTVGDLSESLDFAVADINADVNGLLSGDGSVQSALDTVTVDTIEIGLGDSLGILEVDLGSPQLAATADVSGAVNEVLAAPLVSESGLVSIDLSSGEVLIDLAQLHGGNLNNLPANTTLLSPVEVERISTEATALLGELTDNLTTGVNTSIENTAVTLTLDPELSALAGVVDGDLSVEIETTIAQLLAGDGAISSEAIDVDGEVTLLGGITIPAGELSDELVEPILNQLLPSIAAPLAASLEEGLGTSVQDTVDGSVGPLLDGLTPVFDSLNQVVTLTVNEQSSPGDLGETSFTVRALSVDVLPSVNTASLQFASSSVYAEDAEAPAFDPAITADPTTVEQGESTEITGDGFAAEESVTVSIPGAAEGDDPITVETTTNADGEFTADLPIPDDYPTEDVTVTAVGAESETPVTTGITVVAPGDGGDGDGGDFDTAITADPSTVEQGESTEIMGDGFAAEESVTVSIPGAAEGDDPITVETTTNADGEFTVDLPIPADYPTEDVTVTAEGAESETPATTGITVVAPGEGPGDGDDGDDGAFDTDIVAEPTNVEQGDSTEITGIGFAPEETVTVSIPGAEDGDDPITVDTTTNSDGRFTVDLPIPADYPLGEVDVTAVGAESETPASTELNIVAPGDGGDGEGDFDTAVVVDPNTVEQGDSTEVTGIGFAPEETVTVSIPGAEDGDDPITVETTTDGDGGFTVDLPIPADYPTGDVVVTAVGDESETPATTDLTIVAPGGGNGGDDDDSEADPSVSVDPETAAPGEDVTIEGDDFAPGTTVDIEITDEDGDVIGTIDDVEVDENGEFTQEWTVPEGTNPGDLTVTAEDEDGNSASAPLEIVGAGGAGDEEDADDPSVIVDPDSAEPGETVTIGGDDFTPGATVDIDITNEDGETVGTIEDVEVDADGEFTVDWTLPEDLQPGQLVVTATDEDGNSGSAALDVLSAGAGDGVGVQSDGDAEDASNPGGLAATGATIATFGLVALVLTMLGIGLYVVSRQRRMTDQE